MTELFSCSGPPCRRPGRRLLLAMAGLVVVAVPWVGGWGQAESAKVELVHSQNGVKHEFEVATIKPSQDSSPRSQIMLSPADFAMKDMSVRDMIIFAYGIKSDQQLVGAPNWLQTEHFDIQAKASDADISSFDKVGMEEKMTIPRLLLQNLIEERFQMKAKVETRDLSAYTLVVANGGTKMKEVKPDPLPPPGVSPAPGAHLMRFARTGPNEFTASAWPMNQFVEQLSHFYEVGDRPVLDETGLKGNYDFVLRGVSITAPRGGDSDGSGIQAADLSLFSALPEQLGLRLVPVKVQTEILVIETIQQPSQN